MSKFKMKLRMHSKVWLWVLTIFLQLKVSAQTESANVIIDSVNVVFKGSSSFPYWLQAGQSVNVGSNTAALNVIEFIIDTANNNNLKFSQALTIKTLAKVPALRTWKIESLTFVDNEIVGTKPAGVSSPLSFSDPGTYTWTVPPGVSRICVEVWGGGGYGYSCFTVQPGTSYTVIVGSSASNSSFGGTLLSATGGASGSGTSGGAGGTSNGSILKINGGSGKSGVSSIGLLQGGDGGSAGNGGAGGSAGGKSYCTVNFVSVPCPSAAGGNPGGGGGGGGTVTSARLNGSGSSGGSGKVIIQW